MDIHGDPGAFFKKENQFSACHQPASILLSKKAA
jgi:hypothetical protein